MSNSIQLFAVTLEPLDRFFFGGEVVFGGADSEERRKSYLVRSRYLPQQTSLLGMLREQLLRRNGLLLAKDADQAARQAAADLVGDTGFTIGQDAPFGAIDSLSALALQSHDGTLWQPLPLDTGAGKEGKPLSWTRNGEQWLLQNYDPKQGLSLRFGAPGQSARTLADCFRSVNNVGITVTNRQSWRPDAQDEEAYFYQTTFRSDRSAYATAVRPEVTKDTFRFYFRVALNTASLGNYQSLADTTVTLGGERSGFRMRVAPVDAELNDHFRRSVYSPHDALPAGFERFVLLSDTYLPQRELGRLAVFAVAEPISFRFFSTSLQETNHFFNVDRSQRDEQTSAAGRRQSRRYTLLQRGGVLLVPSAKVDALKTLIEEPAAFRRIGYNQYLHV